MEQHDKVSEAVQEAARQINREVGRFIRKVRMGKHISIRTCAKILGISRRRYTAMENGEAIIGFAEMRILLRLLGAKYEQDFEIEEALGEVLKAAFVNEDETYKLSDEISNSALEADNTDSSELELRIQQGQIVKITISVVDQSEV